MSTIHKEITTVIDGKETILYFKEANKLIYSNMFQTLQKGDYYTAIDNIILNCFDAKKTGFDIIEDEPIKMSIMSKIMEIYLSFKQVQVNTIYIGEKYKEVYSDLMKDHKYIFVVQVGEDVVSFLRPLTKEDYREIFNASITSPLKAISYVIDNLTVGGESLDVDLDTLVSCFQISDFLLQHKEAVLKKK